MAMKDSFPISSQIISESAGSGGRIGVPEVAMRAGGVNPGVRESVAARVVAGQGSPAIAASRLSHMIVQGTKQLKQ